MEKEDLIFFFLTIYHQEKVQILLPRMCLHHVRNQALQWSLSLIIIWRVYQRKKNCKKIFRVMLLTGLDSLPWPGLHPVPFGKSWHSTRPYYPISVTDLSHACVATQRENSAAKLWRHVKREKETQICDSVVGLAGALNYGQRPQPHLPHRAGKASRPRANVSVFWPTVLLEPLVILAMRI